MKKSKLGLIPGIALIIIIMATLFGCSKATSAPSATQTAVPTTTQSSTQSATQSSAPAKTLDIGGIWGLTGPFSGGEVPMQKGEALAADWINKNDPIIINGQKYLIHMIDEDNQSSSPAAVTAAQKLVFQDHVKFVIGDVVPFTIEAARSITDPNGVLFFTSQYDHPDPKYPLTLSAYFPYFVSHQIEYDYLVKNYPNVKTVAISETDDSGNQEAAAVAKQQIQSHNLTMIANETYPVGTTDHLALATKLYGLHPDAIDINMESNTGAGDLIKDLRQLGFTGPILYGAPTDPAALAGMIGSNSYATDVILPSFAPTSPTVQLPDLMKTIIQLWKQTYNIPFVNDALRGWDPLYALAQSIQAAQSLDPATVAKAFENMQTIQTAEGTAGVGGLKTFGINGTIVQQCPLTVIKNGESQFVGWFPANVP